MVIHIFCFFRKGVFNSCQGSGPLSFSIKEMESNKDGKSHQEDRWLYTRTKSFNWCTASWKKVSFFKVLWH